MLWMLEQNPCIRNVALCLDNDSAGHKASARMLEMLREKDYNVIELLPEHKDWNESLKVLSGHTAHTWEPEGVAVTMQMG